MNLNPQQLEAVKHAQGPLLVIAGAGSGKTRVIVHRIAHLIQNQGAHPASILAVTFTNKAAGEMRNRLEKMLGTNLRSLWVSTFHSTCLRILRSYPEKVGLGPNFQILDEGGQIAVIKEVLGELNISEKLITPASALNHISRAKDRCLDPLRFQTECDNFYLNKVALVYEAYQKKLFETQNVDFGDLIRLTVLLLEKNPEILAGYQKRFNHILVDEYQDTNHAQYRLIELLVREHQNLSVVGDEDQSIYRWRGADISNILRFEKDFPGAKVVRLEQNYRSTKTILAAAQKVIENNFGRKAKTLWTEGAQGSALKILSCVSEKAEAEAIANEILDLSAQNKSLNDIAVFYRTNAQSRPFEDVFLANNIPYRIYGGIRFYERMEIKDALAYLRLIANPRDDVSFSRIINVPARGIGKETVNRLKEFAGSQNKFLFEAIPDFCNSSNIRPNTAKKLKSFYQLITELQQGFATLSLADLVREVMEKSGYIQALNLKNDYEAQDRLENINELINAVDEFRPQSDAPQLVQFLDQVALISDLDKMNPDNQTVTLMTIHLAKGLEFENVFMVGLEEGLFPHSRSMDDPEELEEERRLCYVGMTRAKQNLTLSHAFRRSLFGKSQYSVVSRFIDEIPEEYTVRHDVIPAQRGIQSGTNMDSRFRGNDKWMDTVLEYDFDQRHPEERLGQYAAGKYVSHPAFGQGRIKKCEPSNAGHKVTVQFQTGVVKKLIAEKAGLIVLES
ncbi:MAG: UvrD-helicase domain-containing protein [Pseudomonadota bacterium]